VSNETLASVLPPNQEEWRDNSKDVTPDKSFGLQGYFANAAHVKSFLEAIKGWQQAAIKSRSGS
jgi:hypothetical protein